jgi:hypothetical protein
MTSSQSRVTLDVRLNFVNISGRTNVFNDKEKSH